MKTKSKRVSFNPKNRKGLSVSKGITHGSGEYIYGVTLQRIYTWDAYSGWRLTFGFWRAQLNFTWRRF